VYPLWQEAGQWCIYALGLKNTDGELTYARVKCYMSCDRRSSAEYNRFGSPYLRGYEDLVTALYVEIQ
jgi:hypothetical protein